ncbi:protein TANC1 isoform X1 [Tachysurus ichikawai]
MGSGPLPVQPYPTEDVLRVGLSRGVSMSLPSSPMLPPRQPYMLPLRPSTKSSVAQRHLLVMVYKFRVMILWLCLFSLNLDKS